MGQNIIKFTRNDQESYIYFQDVKTSIRVGVVGLPNVGKSSLINSLKRSRACGVGATPGVTKTMQEVQLDSKVCKFIFQIKHFFNSYAAKPLRSTVSIYIHAVIQVKLIDSPGMVLASGDMSDSSVALRNAIKVETLQDPVTPVEAILQRCPKQQMILQVQRTFDNIQCFHSLYWPKS